MMTNAERQAKWLKKNRALHNFRRRKKPVLALAEPTNGDSKITLSGESPQEIGGEARESAEIQESAVLPTMTDSRCGHPTIKKLRELVERVQNEPDVPVVKPQMFRNDYGAVISEGVWKRLQKLKEKAKEGGYVLDEYSQ